MSRRRYNPEKSEFRGRSYKAWGDRIAKLREKSAARADR